MLGYQFVVCLRLVDTNFTTRATFLAKCRKRLLLQFTHIYYSDHTKWYIGYLILGGDYNTQSNNSFNNGIIAHPDLGGNYIPPILRQNRCRLTPIPR